uniref:Uncharacterized protein n=1 Tax=Arundo donax TaxID=35708 RepID=A0A0A9DZC3_ARUDO
MRDLWGQEYRTSSADCAAALDAYYAAFMSFGRGRGAAILRAVKADPSCALAAALAAQFVGPRDPAGAAAFLAAAADNLGKATHYERAVFRTLSALVGDDKDEEVALRVAERIPQGSHVSEESTAHLLLYRKAGFIPEICRTSYRKLQCILCLQILHRLFSPRKLK